MAKSTRKVLVTGGNRGIGLESCRQLGRDGWKVLLTARDPVRAVAAGEVLRAEGITVSTRPLDVARAESVAGLADSLEKDGLQLDALINNAGIALDGFDGRVARQTLDVNFFGAVRVTDALRPRLRDDGRVVMVSSSLGELSSVGPELRQQLLDEALTRQRLAELMHTFARDVEAGVHAERGWPSSAYRVSKVVLNAFTRILARELAGTRLKINAVCPGWVRTDMGGPSAPRSVEASIRGIRWAATLADHGPSGGFFRDGESIPW